MMSRSSVTSGCSLVCRSADFRLLSAHFGDDYPYGLDPDEKEVYDEMIGDMMTND